MFSVAERLSSKCLQKEVYNSWFKILNSDFDDTRMRKDSTK